MYKFVKSIPKTIQATHDMIRNFLCNFFGGKLQIYSGKKNK